jgi:hypothetical protein
VPLDCEAPQGIAATVNEYPIAVAQLCDRLKFLTGGTSPAAGRQVLEQMVEAELFIGALEDRGIEVTEGEIDAELRELATGTEAAKQFAASDLAHEQLRASAHERIARRKLIDALGRLEPSASDLRAAAPRAKIMATVEGWIARLPGNASNEANARAQANATAGHESLERGVEPVQAGLARLPPFELTPDSGEPALEAVMFAPGGAQWQPPVRTRAGWVVARALSVERVEPTTDQTDLRRAAEAQVRQREERRILAELQASAEIVRYVQ